MTGPERWVSALDAVPVYVAWVIWMESLFAAVQVWVWLLATVLAEKVAETSVPLEKPWKASAPPVIARVFRQPRPRMIS